VEKAPSPVQRSEKPACGPSPRLCVLQAALNAPDRLNRNRDGVVLGIQLSIEGGRNLTIIKCLFMVSPAQVYDTAFRIRVRRGATTARWMSVRGSKPKRYPIRHAGITHHEKLRLTGFNLRQPPCAPSGVPSAASWISAGRSSTACSRFILPAVRSYPCRRLKLRMECSPRLVATRTSQPPVLNSGSGLGMPLIQAKECFERQHLRPHRGRPTCAPTSGRRHGPILLETSFRKTCCFGMIARF